VSEKDKRGAGGKGVRLLRGLASLRITEAILLWIALMCIAATVIPQAPYRPTAGVSPAGRVMMLLSLKDVFHSLWFLAPVAVLALNMSACMWVRMGRRGSTRGGAMPRTSLSEVNLPAGSDLERVMEGLRGLISAGPAPAVRDREDPPVLMGEKGSLRRFAPLLVHGSIFFILVGVALAFTGFKGTVEIPEGETRDVATLYDGTPVHLGFALRCNAFDIEYYKNGMPKEYRSRITFIRNGRSEQEKSVLVNHPVSFQGILFSQSGYNQLAEASLTVEGPSGAQSLLAVEGSMIEVEDTPFRIHVMRVVQDMMRMGPGVQLLVEGPESRQVLWLFRDIKAISKRYPGITDKVPQFNPSLIKPYTFVLDGVTMRNTTILGVNRDPGVPFVAVGAVLFIAGITMIFLMAHERVWVLVERDRGGLKVTLARRINGRPVPVDVHLVERVKGLGGRSS